MVQDAALTPITLHAVRGDTKGWSFTVDWDNVMTAEDVTSCRFTVKRSFVDADTAALMALDTSSGVTVTAPSTVEVELAEDDWDDWPDGLASAVWDIEARTSTQVRTVAKGRFMVEADVTVEAPA